MKPEVMVDNSIVLSIDKWKKANLPLDPSTFKEMWMDQRKSAMFIECLCCDIRVGSTRQYCIRQSDGNQIQVCSTCWTSMSLVYGSGDGMSVCGLTS